MHWVNGCGIESLMIKACIPYYLGSLHKRCLESCERAAKDGALYWSENECLCFGTYIHNARNMLISDSTLSRPKIDRRFSHFLCLDSDIVFEPEQLRMLLDADKDIISGVYKKDKGIVAGNVGDRALTWLQTSKGIKEVGWVGAGFLLIKRDVFETIPAPWFTHYTKYMDDCYVQYGEDVSFCITARAYGYKIYLHGGCEVEHLPKQIIIRSS